MLVDMKLRIQHPVTPQVGRTRTLDTKPLHTMKNLFKIVRVVADHSMLTKPTITAQGAGKIGGEKTNGNAEGRIESLKRRGPGSPKGSYIRE